jgi:hypothetical protein
MTSKERSKIKSVPEIYDRKDSKYHFNLGSVKLGINIAAYLHDVTRLLKFPVIIN